MGSVAEFWWKYFREASDEAGGAQDPTGESAGVTRWPAGPGRARCYNTQELYKKMRRPVDGAEAPSRLPALNSLPVNLGRRGRAQALRGALRERKAAARVRYERAAAVYILHPRRPPIHAPPSRRHVGFQR